jgi:hypothetical protein
VDEASHFNGNEKEAEKYHSEKLFSHLASSSLQVVSAKEVNAYKDVQLHRTLYLLRLPGDKKLIVDVFNAWSENDHQYDLPFQYNGQVIQASFKYKPSLSAQENFGKNNGYQFLWKEAEADAEGPLSQLSFLTRGTYYTISSLTDNASKLFFTRTGANDPNFNLRREPSYVIRKKGKNQIFLNVIEMHGKYNPVDETSVNAYPSVKSIGLVQNDADITVAEIMIAGKRLQILQSNKDSGNKVSHRFRDNTGVIEWQGPFRVLYDGKTIE